MTGFDNDQIALLRAPLARDAVKGRQQAGRQVSYIEGWHAIAEANRIFGFDAWDREMVEFRCVSETPCEIGQGKKPGFRVAYIAKVRITVRAGDTVIVRDGTGYGSGIDADVGAAHESAIKEAETDSMKRGMMTFGNPFGLALYDKTQAEVEPINGQRAAPPAPRVVQQPAAPRTPNPVEPPAATAARAAFIAAWWTRPDYGVDPEEIDGGIGRWDYWMLALVNAAPTLDAFLKLRDDSRPFFERWRTMVAAPVVQSFVDELHKVGCRLSAAEGMAA